MTESTITGSNQARPEIFNEQLQKVAEIQAAPQGVLKRLYAFGALRKIIILIMLVLAWEIYALVLNNPLIFPTFTATSIT